MIADLLGLLLETTLALTAAALLVLLLRRPLRRVIGARGAYALWLLLPAAGLAVVLPARTVTLARPVAEPMLPVAIPSVAPLSIEASFDATPWLLAAWGLGVFAIGGVLAWQQRRFRRALGTLRARSDGSLQAEHADAGPAVIGLWRSRIVLPADFDSRYSELERDLVLRHERAHLARRDPLANLAAAALRCLYWFNPLLHYAVGRFRLDQELAVDAAVLGQRPDARRSYADAMLKTQLMLDPPPLGCHWQSAHPLKERIAMLKQPLPGAARLAAGFAFAFALSATTGYVAWASQPARVLDASATAAATPAPAATTAPADDTGSQPASERVDERRLKPPRYPADALKRRVQGKVVLKVKVDRDGSALQAELDPEESSPGVDAVLVAAARDAAMKWSFTPGTDDRGNAIESWVSVPVTFSLESFDQRRDPEITNASYRSMSPVTYPEQAAQGTAFVRVLVDENGGVRDSVLAVSSGDQALDHAAVSAVRGWKFNPAMRQGQAMAQSVLVPVHFARDGLLPAAPPAWTMPVLDAIGVHP